MWLVVMSTTANPNKKLTNVQIGGIAAGVCGCLVLVVVLMRSFHKHAPPAAVAKVLNLPERLSADALKLHGDLVSLR